MGNNKTEYIELTEEQKEKSKHVWLYQDEYTADIWKEYCDSLGADYSSKVLKLNIFSIEEHEEY